MKKVRITKGQIEAQISNAVSIFEKECMGRGPKDIKTKIIQNHILVIIDGFLSQSEQKLADNEVGKKLIKDMRTAVFEASLGQLRKLVGEIVGAEIMSTHSDVSTKTGEKIIVFTVNSDLEEYLNL